MLPDQIKKGLELVNQAPLEAVKHFRQLLEDHPKDAEVVHSLARALIAYANQASNDRQRKTFLEKAKKELEKVIELDDLHATAFDELQELDETLSRLSLSGSSTGTRSGGSGSLCSLGSGTIGSSLRTVSDSGGSEEVKTTSGQRIKLEEEIGRGRYSVVYKGSYGDRDVAVKRFTSIQAGEQLHEFQKETKIMGSVQSPHVMVCLGVIATPFYGFFMEYMANGSLWHCLHSSQAPLGWDQQYQITRDITQGLQALHDHNIIHRDLKSQNVLLSHENRAKLTDFGLSKIKNNGVTNSSSTALNLVGTLAWLAPEIFTTHKHTFASDIYSLGLIIWELTTRQQPFINKDVIGITQTKTASEPRERHEKIPENCSPLFKQLIKDCWRDQTEERPSARDLAVRLAQSNIPSSLDSGLNLVTTLPANTPATIPWEPQRQPVMPLYTQPNQMPMAGLGLRQTSAFSESSRFFQPASGPPITDYEKVKARSLEIPQKYRVRDGEIENALELVVMAELDELKKVLKQSKDKNGGYCPLLHLQGNVTKEGNGESFKEITVWQLAMRECDLKIGDMILTMFRRQDEEKWAEKQFSAMQVPCFDLKDTIDAYEKLRDNWDKWSWDQRGKHWCEVIGGCQKRWPICLITKFGGNPKDWIGNQTRYLGNAAKGNPPGFAWLNGWGKEIIPVYMTTTRKPSGGNEEALGMRIRCTHGDGRVTYSTGPMTKGHLFADLNHLRKEQSTIQEHQKNLKADFASLLHSDEEIVKFGLRV